MFNQLLRCVFDETGNKIGNEGVREVCEFLKANAFLKALDIMSVHKTA